jgi:hypothetical protein
MANMANVDFREIRFTANDGITELPYYILEKTDSTQAVCIVMIPYYFLDNKNEATRSLNGSYATPDPQYIYCYYGNASFMNKGVKQHIEGKDYLIDPRGALINTIKSYEDGLFSAISYNGNKTINEFRDSLVSVFWIAFNGSWFNFSSSSRHRFLFS